MVMPFRRARPVAQVPASAVYVAVGDSITDKYEIGPFPGGQYAAALATRFGMTLTGGGTTPIVTAGGTGYSTYTFTTTGGGSPTRQASGTAWAFGGAIVGVTWSDLGAGFGSVPTIPNGGGGAGAAFAGLAIAGGAVRDGVVPGTNSYDATRSSMGGTTMQAGGLKGHDFVTDVATRCTVYNPNVVSIFLGTNDYLQATTSGITVAKFKVDYQTALTAIRALGTKPVIVLLGMLPLSTVPAGGLPAWMASIGDGLRQFNQAIAELALDNGCTFVPLISMPTDSGYFPLDTIHPSQTLGHTYILEQMTRAMTGLL